MRVSTVQCVSETHFLISVPTPQTYSEKVKTKPNLWGLNGKNPTGQEFSAVMRRL